MQVLALAAVMMMVGAAEEGPRTEGEKIEALIKHVEGLEKAKFVRNGVEYDAKAAGQFLRGKWKAQEASVKTAQDFIVKVASQSSTTGKPYLIKLEGDREVKSAEYLVAALKKMESAEKK